jgi:DNA primase
MSGDAVMLTVPGPQGPREVRLSSPSRVLFPRVGVTKLDLAEYLISAGDAFVTANGDRPMSLQRFPAGVDGEHYFSKNPPKGAPDYVRAVTVAYPSGREHPQLVIDEPAGAVWAAQMNTIVFHSWASRAGAPDLPDELRIDLDPQPGTDFDDARVVAIELRGERIFVDFSQANRDRTMAGAYSPRPLAHAPVSCPLDWNELEGADPAAFTILTVPERLRTTGDPWATLHAAPGTIDTLLSWWQRDDAAGLGELPFPPDFPKMPGDPPRVQPSRAKAGRAETGQG